VFLMFESIDILACIEIFEQSNNMVSKAILATFKE
jgi:hypothetical protein